MALIGPRQVGKTTLARRLAETADSVYLDLEDPVDLAKLDDAAGYLRGLGRRLVVVDEVQRAPGLFQLLRVLIDGIRSALAAHLDALIELGQDVKPQADLLVLRHDARAPTRRERLRFVGPGALMGKKTTQAKAEAARRNGRKGGRPAERARLSSRA